MTTTAIKTRVQFGVRPISEDDGTPTGRFYCEIIAVTPSEKCYRLGHAASDDIQAVSDITLEYAYRCWKEDRHLWLPDFRGAAGVKVWLNEVNRSEG
jgi:hypothetical protein